MGKLVGDEEEYTGLLVWESGMKWDGEKVGATGSITFSEWNVW